MTDKIAEWIEKLATGKKARIFWAIVIALIVALFILFPFIDANLLFANCNIKLSISSVRIRLVTARCGLGEEGAVGD